MRSATRSMRSPSWSSSATSARASPRPIGRSSNPPKASPDRLHAHPRQLLYSHSGGNMPQYLVNRFAEEIASGETELALICGAELLRSTQNARKAGMAIDWNEDPGRRADPDRRQSLRLQRGGSAARAARRHPFLSAAGERHPRRAEARRRQPHDGDGQAVPAARGRGEGQSAGDPSRGLQRRAAGDDLRRQSLDLLPLPAADERQRHHRPGRRRAGDLGRQGARMGHPAGALGVPAWLRRRHRHLGRLGARRSSTPRPRSRAAPASRSTWPARRSPTSRPSISTAASPRRSRWR